MRQLTPDNYNTIYFLASLGNGWLVITFFLYFMFLINNKANPMPDFADITALLDKENMFLFFLTLIAILSIIYFAYRHFSTLIWNIKHFLAFQKTSTYQDIINSSKIVTLMSIPLTLAMSVNVLFVLWTLFVPWLWGFVEILFPMALTSFFVIWVLASVIFYKYLSNIFLNGGEDTDQKNDFAGLISVFAFSMIWVWLAASSAMSSNQTTFLFATLLSWMFLTISIILLNIKTIFFLKATFKNWLNKMFSPSLLMFVPILTLIGITTIRIYHGIAHHILNEPVSGVVLFLITWILFIAQFIIMLFWIAYLTKNWYFQDYIFGKESSPISYWLICPWVAFFVFAMFFLHSGLVENGFVEQFSLFYYIILWLFFIFQIWTIALLARLNQKLLN